MVQSLSYVVDPADPRAPTHAEWERLSPPERERVVAALPALVSTDVMAPEGDPHRKGKIGPLDALERFFRTIGRKVYLSSELAVFYPGERRIVPDVLAVLDVEPHERMKWVVDLEGKGLDFVLEVHVAGDASKDHDTNVVFYAKLGIPEYFIFDRGRLRLRGYRLRSAEARAYEPIVPNLGRLSSAVLGLDLAIEGNRLRLFHGTAALDEADDLIGRLGSMVDGLLAKREEAEARAMAEAARATAEAARADEAEKRLADALAEIERLKRER